MRTSVNEVIIAVLMAVAVTFMLVATGCVDDGNNNSALSGEEAQMAQTQQMHTEAHRQVGMPELTNFQELEFAKAIAEMRDDAISTYTYMVDMNGNRHFICRSLGFGLPYSTQMTNPKTTEWKVRRSQGASYSSAVTPQPEPSGLYMPDNVDATWIICDDGDGGIEPIYSEPQLLVSPFKLHDEDDGVAE